MLPVLCSRLEVMSCWAEQQWINTLALNHSSLFSRSLLTPARWVGSDGISLTGLQAPRVSLQEREELSPKAGSCFAAAAAWIFCAVAFGPQMNFVLGTRMSQGCEQLLRTCFRNRCLKLNLLQTLKQTSTLS